MTNKTLNVVATAFSVTILIGWGIYWSVQVQDVLDLFELARAF